MPMSLRRVLMHPSMSPAKPRVLAGASGMHRRVRWIHSSEVIEIAPLLRGGELLLTGGTVLAERSEPDQRRYVKELAERGVAGVAIETGGALPVVPSGVLEEAARLGFPVIELRRVVPFVEIAEAINGELIDASVTNLRYVAELTHALSGVVVDGGGTAEILVELVARTGTKAVLYDSTGRVLDAADVESVSAGSADSADSPDSVGSADSVGSMGQPPVADGFTAPVTIRGVHVATLWLAAPTNGTDRVELAATTATESLSLAMLRTRALSDRELAARELVRLAAAGPTHAGQLESLGRVIEFRPEDPVVGIAAMGAGAGVAASQLDDVIRRYGATALDVPGKAELHILVSLKEHRAAAFTRAALLDALRDWVAVQAELVVVVGPVVPTLATASLSLTAALQAASLESRYAHQRVVIDVHARLVDRLLDGAGQRDRLDRLAAEELAMFDLLPAKARAALLETLETYLDSGCNKSATAKRLRVTRQALYGRLERAFALLGGDPTGTSRALGLQLALRVRHLR